MSTLITLDTQNKVKLLLSQLPTIQQMADDGDIDALVIVTIIYGGIEQAELTEAQFNTLRLRHIEGHTFAEVAKKLGYSAVSTVYEIESAATKKVAKYFKDLLSGGDESFAAYGKDVDS